MIKKFFKNKSILVTGASGSIGSEIVLKLLATNCKVVRALSNDENGIYQLMSYIDNNHKLSLKEVMKKNKVRFLIGDVRDYERNLDACKNINIVIHAAAMKHVPLCEYNYEETYKTNVIGTKNLIRACLKRKVKLFLLISTDKAANPSSVMGKSKLEAEKIILKSNSKKNQTKFSAIRFGNVIGSRGSVLPKFLDQIKNNQQITVNDKNATRFFITINQATNQIFNALKIMSGKEIFIIKNMYAIKIFDLARALKNIFNYKKKIKIVRLSEGEKLHEELITQNELAHIYFLNNSIKKNNNLIKKNFENEFRSDMVYNLNIKQIKNFLIKDFKLLIPKSHKEHH
jgi:UDP-N-acetylglucosamine 4,6-dehydratase